MIREMNEEDINVVAKLELDLFSSPWKAKDFMYELHDNPYAKYYVFIKDEKIVGYCGLWTTFEQAQITTIGVKEAYQRQHIASSLMDKMIETANIEGCENISLEVRVSNTKAQALYTKYGFITINTRKSYYQDNHEDAYLMMKPLGGAQ